MRLLLVLVSLSALPVLTVSAQAQGVRQDLLTPEDLLLLFDNAVALEVDVPEGATGFRLSRSLRTPLIV